MTPARADGTRSRLVVPAAYAASCVAVLWPAVRHFRTAYLLGGGDGFVFVWAWWWLPQRLASGSSPFDGTGLFHPVGVDLSLTTTAPLVSLASWPVRALFGPAAQINAVQLGSTFATALLTYALARRVTESRPAAFLAGAAFAFAPYRFVHLSHLNLVNTWTIALALLLFLRFLDAPGTGRGCALGAAVGSSFLVDPQLTVLVLTSLVVIAACRWRTVVTAARSLVLGGLVALVAALPLLIPMAAALRAGEADTLPGLGGAQLYSSDVLSWVVPSPLGLLSPFNPALSLEGVVAPGVVLLCLAVIGREVVPREARRMWVMLALTAFILSLGPFLHLAGRTGSGFNVAGVDFAVPLPFLALRLIPGVDALRVPGRFGILGVLAIDLLAAQTLGALLSRRRSSTVIAALAAVSFLTAAELLPSHLPSSSARTPAPYQAIARDPDPGAVLELPLQWSTGTRVVGDLAAWRENTELLGYAATHHRAIVSGSASRYPAKRLRRLTEDPLYRQVLALEAEPGYTDTPTFGSAELRAAGIAYVVYHRDRPLPRVEPYLSSLSLAVAADDGTVIAWKVPTGGTS
jgi:hypothetical protein